jgi:hypothetical protein
VPGALLERLNEEDARRLTGLAAAAEASVPPVECARALRMLRYQRERADLQREIDRLQQTGAGAAAQIDALLQQKSELLSRIEALGSGA